MRNKRMEGERVPELEKIIKRLENLRDSIATDCIHDTYQAIGTINDALELLKEQAVKTAGDNKIPLKW